MWTVVSEQKLFNKQENRLLEGIKWQNRARFFFEVALEWIVSISRCSTKLPKRIGDGNGCFMVNYTRFSFFCETRKRGSAALLVDAPHPDNTADEDR